MRERTLFLLFLAFLVGGCATGYEEEIKTVQQNVWVAALNAKAKDSTRIAELIWEEPAYQEAIRLRESIMAKGPYVRAWNDSLARIDSLGYAWLYISRVSNYFYHHQDTTHAVFAFLEGLPWFESMTVEIRGDHVRRFAETVGYAISATHSPNMARLTYQAFERAKRLALDHGDPMYIHLADSSYKATARQVLTMPDSVRAAFGPAPERPARIPWVLATLAAAFIAASVTGGWGRASRPI